jgi:chromatin remodeling complex protein RSC6
MAKAKQNAFFNPVTPSKELAEITGSAALPRTEVVRKIWAYIKSNNLQNPKNKREIMADDKLRPIFGRDAVSMFDMNKLLSKHLR